MGTGFHRAGGSERVREVQRRLWRLGFRPGPVDGMFGPQTRAAVQWFQIKHGFTPDGVVDLRTLALLRERTGAGPTTAAAVDRRPTRGEQPTVRGAAPQPQPVAQPAERGGRQAAGEHGLEFAPVGLAAVLLLLLAAPLAFFVLRRRGAEPTKAPKTRRPEVPREAAPGPASQPPATATAIGYVRTNGDRAALARHAGTIRQACTTHGWKLADLVRDDLGAGKGAGNRPGLTKLMHRLAGPGETRLVVSKLAHLSRSAAELASLFEWFAENEVRVVAADAGIDTTTDDGARAAQVLLAKVARRQAEPRAANGHGHNGSNGNGSNGSSANGNGSNGNGSNGKAKIEFAGATANGKGEHG
jgi:hypothetical protein